jgi:hypothetical protein
LNASEPASRWANETGGRPPFDELNATMDFNPGPHLGTERRQADYTKS